MNTFSYSNVYLKKKKKKETCKRKFLFKPVTHTTSAYKQLYTSPSPIAHNSRESNILSQIEALYYSHATDPKLQIRRLQGHLKWKLIHTEK